METMRAAVFAGPEEGLRIEELRRPAPKRGEVLVASSPAGCATPTCTC